MLTTYQVEDLACEAFINNLKLMGVDCTPKEIKYNETKVIQDGTIETRWRFYCHVDSPDFHAVISGAWYDGHPLPCHLSVDIISSF